MRWFGKMPETEYQNAVKNNQSIKLPLSLIHESEEWVWLGRSDTNINSNFPQLFQQNRKLWVYSQCAFQPLEQWQGRSIMGGHYDENTGRTSTIWKIATKRKVPLSIVLENTRESNRGWVKKNWSKWIKESREEINNAIGKRKKVEEARELLQKERIKRIQFAKEQAKYRKENGVLD